MITVKEMVKLYLKKYSYDGLYNPESECACKLDELMQCEHYCGTGQESCCAGYLQPVTYPDIEFVIGKNKPEAIDNAEQGEK